MLSWIYNDLYLITIYHGQVWMRENRLWFLNFAIIVLYICWQHGAHSVSCSPLFYCCSENLPPQALSQTFLATINAIVHAVRWVGRFLWLAGKASKARVSDWINKQVGNLSDNVKGWVLEWLQLHQDNGGEPFATAVSQCDETSLVAYRSAELVATGGVMITHMHLHQDYTELTAGMAGKAHEAVRSEGRAELVAGRTGEGAAHSDGDNELVAGTTREDQGAVHSDGDNELVARITGKDQEAVRSVGQSPSIPWLRARDVARWIGGVGNAEE